MRQEARVNSGDTREDLREKTDEIRHEMQAGSSKSEATERIPT